MTIHSNDNLSDARESSPEKGKFCESGIKVSPSVNEQQPLSFESSEKSPDAVEENFDPVQKSCNEIPCVSGTFLFSCFDEVVPVIAKSMELGFVCFLNPENSETELLPASMLSNPEKFYQSNGTSAGQKPFQHLLWNDCLMFEPLPEDELQKLAEDFKQYMVGQPVYDKLILLMNRRKPFSKINTLIAESAYSEFWNSYKMSVLGKIIYDKLALHLTNEKKHSDKESAK